MSKLLWKVQATIFRLAARIVPTCFLQEELSGREGVVSDRVPIGQSFSIVATGPCVLTINRD